MKTQPNGFILINVLILFSLILLLLTPLLESIKLQQKLQGMIEVHDQQNIQSQNYILNWQQHLDLQKIPAACQMIWQGSDNEWQQALAFDKNCIVIIGNIEIHYFLIKHQTTQWLVLRYRDDTNSAWQIMQLSIM